MKRLLSVLLAVMMAFSLMAPVSFADNETAAPAIEVTAGNDPTTGKITLSWTAVEGAAKYEIYRSGSKNGEYKLFYTTTKLNYTNTGSYAGYWYSYKVKALDASGNEIVTSDIVTHCADCAAPVVTAGNRASDGKVTLSWKAVSGAAKYEIYRATARDGEYVRMYTTVYTGYTNTSSQANNTYYYKVVALSSRTASANSAFSKVVARTCDVAAPVVTTSNNPETGKVVLTWKPVEGTAKYEVYRSGTKNGTYTKFYTTSNTKYTNTSAYAGYTYYYKVKAISAVAPEGDSAFSSIVSRTCDCAMPTFKVLGYDDDGSPIYGISNNSNGNSIFVWNKVSGATSYKVYRSGSQNGTYKLLGETKSNSFTDTTATAGYYYFYKIVAVSSRTSYADSAALAFTEAPLFPQAKNLKNVSDSKATKLQWSAIKGVDEYLILYGETNDISEMNPVGEVTTPYFVDNGIYKNCWYAVVGIKYRSDNTAVPSMPAYIYVK